MRMLGDLFLHLVGIGHYHFDHHYDNYQYYHISLPAQCRTAPGGHRDDEGRMMCWRPGPRTSLGCTLAITSSL